MKTISKVSIGAVGAACCAVFLLGLAVFGVSLKLQTHPETASAATVTCSQSTSPIKDLVGLSSITIIEKTGINNTLTYTPTSSSLSFGTSDLNTTASEHYDFYYSNADGTPNPSGAYISSKMHRDVSMANAQSGNNIDSMRLSLSSGTYFADLVASYQLGASVSSEANAALPKALGAPDGVVSTVGDQDSRITLGFCAAFPVVTQCGDGIDNDNDGATDWPNDFSCSSSSDPDETFPKAACQDNLDNDNDGFIDYPQDPGCTSKQDNDEFHQIIYQCSDNIDNDNDGASDYPNDFSCSSPTDNDETNPRAACQDGLDNDNDGFIDYPQDPGCASKQDNDEFNQLAQCQDGIDNDNDGATDYPNDFSCASPTDNDETNPKAACQDGLDNDNDNLTDYPQDPGCASKQDNDEFNVVITCSSNAQCGTDGFTGNLTCQGNDVYQNYRTYTCNNPGTGSSFCSNSNNMQLKQMCAAAQGCDAGGCFPETW